MKMLVLIALTIVGSQAGAQERAIPPNVLFIIADDLTAEAVGSYGNSLIKTPAIDGLASEGVRFERAYSQYPVCGPSRASLMFGYYPTATETYGYVSGREAVGPDRPSMAQWFKEHGYYTARVSKIFHMGIPIDIETGADGTDDPASWTERFNVQGPEWMAAGKAELVQNNPDGTITRKGGNVMTIVQAEGGDLEHADGKAAAKAIELISAQKHEPFFIAVGLVRPHVPFVAPKSYFDPYPWDRIVCPPVVENDWEDIPQPGINYVTSQHAEMNTVHKQKAIAGYYASVSFMDAQVGKILTHLREEGLADNTIVVFVSDHGFHLGEHDFWMKVSLHEESVRVPMIIRAPGLKSGVTASFAELVDLYPTLADLAGLPIPNHLQGKSLKHTLDNNRYQIRDAAFSVSKHGKALLLRTERWAFIQYGEDAQGGMELFDMYQDPGQFTNVAADAAYRPVVKELQKRMERKLAEVRINDLGKTYSTN